MAESDGPAIAQGSLGQTIPAIRTPLGAAPIGLGLGFLGSSLRSRKSGSASVSSIALTGESPRDPPRAGTVG